MNAVLDRCDREGLPAYLEASSDRSRKLYERLGFELTGRPSTSRTAPGCGRCGANPGRTAI